MEKPSSVNLLEKGIRIRAKLGTSAEAIANDLMGVVAWFAETQLTPDNRVEQLACDTARQIVARRMVRYVEGVIKGE